MNSAQQKLTDGSEEEIYIYPLIVPINGLLDRINEIYEHYWYPSNIRQAIETLYDIIIEIQNTPRIKQGDTSIIVKLVSTLKLLQGTYKNSTLNVNEKGMPKTDEIIKMVDNTFEITTLFQLSWSKMDMLYTYYNAEKDTNKKQEYKNVYMELKKKLCESAMKNVKKMSDYHTERIHNFCDSNKMFKIRDSVQIANTHYMEYTSLMEQYNDIVNHNGIPTNDDDILSAVRNYQMYRTIALMSDESDETTITDDLKLLKLKNDISKTELVKRSNEAVKNYISFRLSKENGRDALDHYVSDVFLLYGSIVGTLKENTIKTTQKGGKKIYQTGGTLKYIDMEEEVLSRSTIEKELLNEMKRDQEEELLWIQKMNDLTTDTVKKKEIITWKFYIDVQLYLYPGDKLPFSVASSIKCDRSRDNVIQNINDVRDWFTNTKRNLNANKSYQVSTIRVKPKSSNNTVKNKKTV